MLAAILSRAVATYANRTAGIALASRLSLSPRAQAAFDAPPPALLTAVVAPTVLVDAHQRRDAGGDNRGGETILAAMRLSLLAFVAVGVAAIVGIRQAGC